jgi:hypothetical protein
MATLSAQQAADLAKNFLELAKAIGDFRYRNWDRLSKAKKKKLAALKLSALKSGEDILALSATLVMNDVKTTLEQINNLTLQIKETINNLQNIQKGINLAAAVVTLGTAIISRNPLSVVDAIKGAADTLNENLVAV